MTDASYTFNFSMLTSGAASFVANAPAGVTPAGVVPAGAAATAALMVTPASAPGSAGAPAGIDANALLSASPFEPLLNLPGISADSLLASLSEGNGFGTLAALGTAAGNPFASLTGSGNPFPAGSANPFENYSGVHNPFASSSNPFGSINPTGA